MPSVTSLVVHPIKAMNGVPVNAVTLSNSRLQHDRAFCVVDTSGKRYPCNQALSMRNFPTLASIKVEFDSMEGNPSSVILTSPLDSSDKLIFPLNPTEDDLASKVAVECGGASTTSAGS